MIKDYSTEKEITGRACYQMFLEKSSCCYALVVRKAQEAQAHPSELHNTVSQTAFIKHESTLFNPYTVPMLTSRACTRDRRLTGIKHPMLKHKSSSLETNTGVSLLENLPLSIHTIHLLQLVHFSLLLQGTLLHLGGFNPPPNKPT